MIKYRTKIFEQIEKFEVISETEKTITYNPSGVKVIKEFKNPSWNTWHNSFDEAKEYLICLKKQQIVKLASQINDINIKIEKLNKLTEQ